MKITLIGREDETSRSVWERLKSYLEAAGHRIVERGGDLLITVGGDGTLLRALRTLDFPDIPVLGINTGHLGFYADLTPEEAGLIPEFLERPLSTEPYRLLSVSFIGKSARLDTLVLNDAVIRANTIHTSRLSLLVDGLLFETLRGDGMVVSTPSGSTGYNKSIGGAVLDPSIPAFQVAELAPINNIRYRSLERSMCFSWNQTVELQLEDDYKRNPILGADAESVEIPDLERMVVSGSDRAVHFLRVRPFPFWQRVKERFLQG